MTQEQQRRALAVMAERRRQIRLKRLAAMPHKTIVSPSGCVSRG